MSESEQPKRPPEEKPPAAKPLPASPERRARQRRGRQPRAPALLAIVALILALIALAGVGALGWSRYQLRGEQTRISQLEGRVSALNGQLATIGNSSASAKSVNALAGHIADLRQKEQSRRRNEKQRLHEMAQRLEAVSSRISGVTAAYRADEAAGLMELAQAKLALEADPRAATRALKLADHALDAANNPRLAPAHLALMREIAALRAVPTVDVAGAYVQLQTLISQVGSLPLAGDRFASASPPAAGSAPSGWSRIGAAFKRAFSPLIVVRHGPAMRPLLPPNQVYFVRANLRLTLASAQLALLQGKPKAWHASLNQARDWLANWFSSSEAKVEQATESLNRLDKLKLAPALPKLGAALAALKAVRAAQPPTPPPPATTQ
jgi:uncharacterized protein HemX